MKATYTARADKPKLYVAGLPSRLEEEQIMEYFRQFGEVLRAEIRQSGGIEALEAFGNKHKHYCVLTVSNVTTANSIIGAAPHTFCGRKLLVSWFRTGMDLILHNHRCAKRRVLIKKVPSFIQGEHLIQEIGKLVGPVESYFRYEPDRIRYQNSEFARSRRYSTYSVTMTSKIGRDKLLALSPLMLAPQTLSPVEPFRHSKDLAIHVLKTHKAVQPEEPAPLILGRTPSAVEPSTRHSLTNATYLCSSGEYPMKTSQEFSGKLHWEEERQRFPGDQDIKPTSKKYHEVLAQVVSPAVQAQYPNLNLRFNLNINKSSATVQQLILSQQSSSYNLQ